MDKIPNNIFLYHIFPYFDFFVYCDLLTFRQLNHHYKKLISKYLTQPSPQTYSIKYINEIFLQAKELNMVFEKESSESLENINKITHGLLIDYLAQSNQNKVENDVLLAIGIVMEYVGAKKKPVEKGKSRTENKKRKIAGYIEFVGDYWSFKNKILSVDIWHMKKRKIDKMMGKIANISIGKIAELECLISLFKFIELLSVYLQCENKGLIFFSMRNQLAEKIIDEIVEARIEKLRSVFVV